MTYVVGLTGGIGSGKTLVSDHFASLGVPIIDTDLIARQIVEPGSEILNKLSKVFGSNILLATGELDRDALRTIAFTNTHNKEKLDAIMHPAIRTETIRQVEAVAADYCIVVVPLLEKDSPFVTFMDRIIAVTADEDIRIARVMRRNQLSEANVVKIMATQITDHARSQFADDVIENNGSIEQTLKIVDDLHLQFLNLVQT